MNSYHISSRRSSIVAFISAFALCLIAAGCAGTRTTDSTGEYVDDSVITAKVKSALLGDDAVKSFQIKVVTHKGVVQLSGFVDNVTQKNAAGQDASAVPAVKEVKNDLIVK